MLMRASRHATLVAATLAIKTAALIGQSGPRCCPGKCLLHYALHAWALLYRHSVVDVMLLHSCDLATLQKGEALGALVKARDAGKIRFAGYSGDNEAAAWAAAHPDIAVLETSISIADQRNICRITQG